MRTHALLFRLSAATALTAPLFLTACNNAKIVSAQDSFFCDKQGFPSGTDGNVDCALKRAEERTASGAPEAPDPILSPPPKGSPKPPPRAGGARQILEVTVRPDVTATVHFAFVQKEDCSVGDPPTMLIDRQPEHGTARVVPRTDFPNVTATGATEPCADKRVSGFALEYTPIKTYEGYDYLEFRTLTKSGALTLYKTQIAVEKPEPSDDD
jgi:hypothetical protein